MSLTILQHSNDKGYPHFVNYPRWFLVSSSIVDNYFDFKYKFKVYDETDTLVKSYLSTPDEYGNGVMNIQTVAKSMVNGLPINFSTSAVYQKLPDYFKEYKIKVSEFYDNTENNEITLDKNLVSGLLNTKDQNASDYFESISGATYFTNREPGVNYKTTYDGRGSICFLNGKITGDTQEYENEVKGFECRINYNDGTYKYYKILNNITDSEFLYTSGLTLQDKLAVLFQTQLESWEGLTFILVNNNGTTTHSYQIIDVEDVKNYEIESFDDSSVYSGIIYKFDVVCSGEDNYNVLWINDYGTLDYFSFSANSDKTIESNKKVYNHINITTSDTTYRSDYTNLREISPYENIVNMKLKLRTDNLSKKETEYLRSLWAAKYVYIQEGDDTNYIPINSLKVSNTIKNSVGFVRYDLDVEYGKIIYV